MTTPESTESAGISRGLLMALVGLVIAAAVIITVIVSTSGGDDSADAVNVDTAAAAHIPVDGALRQTSFVDVHGDMLEPHSPDGVDPMIGQQVPNITASYFDNTEATIDFADGQPRLVMFLTHWCPHCQAEVETLTSYWQTADVPTDVEIIAVSASVDQGGGNYPPSEWLLREEWPIPTFRDSDDGTFGRAFGLLSFPYAVVVDGDGKVVNRHVGQLDVAGFNTYVDIARQSGN